MNIHPFDNHSTDVEQELSRELQAIAQQIRQALQNHKQRVARAENQESVNTDTQIPASPYARLWEESWWATATSRDLAEWATAADQEAPYRADAAAAYHHLDDKLRNEYGLTLADYLAYLKEHGWEERYEQHQAEERAEERENLSDSERQKELDSNDPAEAQEHENQSEQAHAQAGHEWDQAEARGERAAYYEAHYDSETAHAAKLNDQSLGTHPHQAVAAAKARGPQQQAKPARAVQQQVHQQHELSH